MLHNLLTTSTANKGNFKTAYNDGSSDTVNDVCRYIHVLFITFRTAVVPIHTINTFNSYQKRSHIQQLQRVRNLMAHAQKPHFVFRLNGRVHSNRRGSQFSRLLAAEVCASALVMLDTPPAEVVREYWLPLHSPVSPSLPLPCVTVCHHIPNAVYQKRSLRQ